MPLTWVRVSIHLRRTEENSADIEVAVARLGRRVGMPGLLGHLNRQAAETEIPGRITGWGFRWDETDSATRRWWPQGITTSADASETEDLHGRRLLVTSWYAKNLEGTNQGSRITVVDLDTLRYRHVLLVVPRPGADGEALLEPLLAHAGGLVWYGPYLHVAGTRRGLFTFALDDLIRVEEPATVFGYRYVLPVRFAYDATASRGTEQMRYSFLSLDRSTDPPQLLAGEYGRGEQTRRLVRFPLDPATWHLSCHPDGISRPLWIDERGTGQMQGAATVSGTYYVTTSRGSHRPGRLVVGRPGHFRRRRRSLPIGPEDICYWPSTDTLWSVTEHPGHRYVFSVHRPRLGRMGWLSR